MNCLLATALRTLLLVTLAVGLAGCSSCGSDTAQVQALRPTADAGEDAEDRDAEGEVDGGGEDSPDAGEDALQEDAGGDVQANAVPSGAGNLAGGGVRRSGRFQVKMSVGAPVAGETKNEASKGRVGVGAPQAAEVPPENT